MSELDEVRRLFRRAVQQAEDDRVQVMLTGRRVDADTVTLAGAERDKVWVRSTDDSREQTQAWGQSAIANAHVRVRRNAAGELELDGPAYGSGLATGIQASVTLPVLDGRVTKATWYGHNFSPGRVRRSDGGGLTATVEGFVFNGAAVGNTEIALTATATSGKQALSCVVYNPLTGAFSQVTGSNFDAGTPVSDVEAYNSLTLAQGLVPLGGFLLANGATTLEGARWVDARTYLEPRGPLHRYDATSNPGTGDDSADGYSIGSLWHNVTADTMYVCLDATVGAAVWKLATGGGVTVKEVDGTPSVANVTEIRVTNGTLTDVGSGVVEIATGGGGGGSATAYILLRDEKAAGTSGGTFTSGAWQTRTLNTEVVDTGGHCTLTSNQFTLASGTYRIRASAPAYNVLRHQTRLRNITDGSTTLVGSSEYAGTENTGQSVFPTTNRSHVSGRFTITASKAFEIQHRCEQTRNTFGFGVEANFGEVEVYTIVELEKE